ncbi:MAG TPA: hypothetical protein VF534_25340 [Paraburkholderia sp.]
MSSTSPGASAALDGPAPHTGPFSWLHGTSAKRVFPCGIALTLDFADP